MSETQIAKARSSSPSVQISDSHIGFNKPANPDVNATLQATVDKINSLALSPEFIIHTGDLSHLARASEFDTMDGILQGAKQQQIYYVPGEHDTSSDDGKQYLERDGKGTKGRGWYSFDQKGVHFVGLVNVGAQKGLGKLGGDQLEWLEEDVKGRSASTPIVLFAHIPLWTLYPDWGWGTEDSKALGYLKRFGSVIRYFIAIALKARRKSRCTDPAIGSDRIGQYRHTPRGSANPGVVYVGTAGYGVFKSSNGGASWSAFNDGLTYLSVQTLALAAGNPHFLYAGTWGGIFRIDDAPPDARAAVTAVSVMSTSALSFCAQAHCK